jgi:protein CpxP
MKTKTIGTILLATTLSVAGMTYAIAGNQQGMKGQQNCSMMSENGQGRYHGNKQNKQMGFAQLDLSDQQKQEMRSIMPSQRGNNKNQKSDAERAAQQAEMQALMHAETFDTERATELIANNQAKNSERRLEMLEAKHQMFQLLTDEQKVKYSELQMQRRQR